MPARTKQKAKRAKRSAGKTRTVKLKHLTPGEWFEKLVAVQARLRAPKGCPWDREQTHQTLRTYLLEEAYEVLEALDHGDDAKFAEEMGDLLLQIVFHSQIAQEEGRFNVSDVIREIHDKMIRRHPHVIFLPRLKNARAELVEARIILGRLDLINKLSVVEWDHIRLSVGVLARPEDVDVERHIAIRHIQQEVNQPRLRLVEGEPEPMEPPNHRCVSIFTLRWSVGALVIAAEYGLAQFERLGVLPRTVGRRSDEAPLKVSYTAWQGSCTLENLAEGRANLRSLRSGS